MSSESHSILRHFYIWETEVPVIGNANRKSEEFSLRGIKWHFQLSGRLYKFENDNYVHREDWKICMVFHRRPYSLWNVHLQIEEPSGAFKHLNNMKSNNMILTDCHGRYCLCLMDPTETVTLRLDRHVYLSRNGRLRFVITVEDVVENVQSVRNNGIGVTRPKVNISTQMFEDMRKMYLNNDYADLELTCEDRCFPVLRKVLAARSPAFASTLQSENRQNYNDFDSDTLEAFLKFLYTGEVNISSVDMALNIFKMAGKYEVSLLGAECMNFFSENLTVDLIPQYIFKADEYKCKALLYTVVNFLVEVEDEEDSYQNSDEWLIFADVNPGLAARVSMMINNEKEAMDQH